MALIQLVSYLVAALCFLDLFRLGSKLGAERIGSVTQRQFWTMWMPGGFTAKGQALRRRINTRFLLGAIFLVAGLVLGRLAV